eukprot:TRINITY_DN5180_c0_g2_i1.p1 TRINITY_DN5180_c0_g2~~TRINITY_DN5180_c0_g2_i1.p1  ORF type:complete len:435 (+),score=81.90 TRINITY_DN5180_c0_g2_i1:106-1410(+)
MLRKLIAIKHTNIFKMQPYNHSTPVKKVDFEILYNELLNEKKQLLHEIQEYRALEPIFNRNKETCDEAYAECEKFMQVLLVRYEKVIRSETEEKERSRRWSLESDELKEMITSLSGQVLEKDKEIEFLRSTNQLLENRLRETEDIHHKFETELDDKEKQIHLLTDQNEETEVELSNTNSKLESLKRETINKFQQKGDKFDDYMDQVALLHTDINRTLQRCNIPADRIVKPVRISYDEQIEAMNESVKQLDQVASNAINNIIRQESFNQLNKENDDLRDELVKNWEKLQSQERSMESAKMIIRLNKVKQKELEERVNKNADKERERSIYVQQLTKKNDELNCESARYQDEMKMLQKEIDRLQKVADDAHRDVKTAMLEFNEEPYVLIERNILLQQKIKEYEDKVIICNNEIISLEKVLERIKTVSFHYNKPFLYI